MCTSREKTEWGFGFICLYMVVILKLNIVLVFYQTMSLAFLYHDAFYGGTEEDWIRFLSTASKQ